MPSCYICDKGMDDVKLDPRDMKTRPCAECEAIVAELLEEFEAEQEQEDDEINVAYIVDEEYEYIPEYVHSPTDYSNS